VQIQTARDSQDEAVESKLDDSIPASDLLAQQLRDENERLKSANAQLEDTIQRQEQRMATLTKEGGLSLPSPIPLETSLASQSSSLQGPEGVIQSIRSNLGVGIDVRFLSHYLLEYE